MPSPRLATRLAAARRDVLDRLDLTPAERALVEREAANLLDEWFHARRRREWHDAHARAVVVPALFAVLTHVTDREARDMEARRR